MKILKETYQNSKPVGKLLFVFGLMILLMIISAFIGIVAAKIIYQIDFGGGLNIDVSNTTANTISALKLIQLIQSSMVFILLPLFIIYLEEEKISAPVPHKIQFQTALLSILALISLIPFINYLGYLNSKISFPQWVFDAEEKNKGITELFLSNNNWYQFIYSAIIVAIIPGIGEELLFRRVIQHYLQKWFSNHHAAIWLAAILFSALHMQFLGFFPRLFLGAFLGYLYYHSENIVLPILCHFANNFLALIAAFFIEEKRIYEKIENFGTSHNDLFFVLIGLVPSIVLFYQFYKKPAN